jgi:hypothetical protein
VERFGGTRGGWSCEEAPEWYDTSAEWLRHRDVILAYLRSRQKLWQSEFGPEELVGDRRRSDGAIPKSHPASVAATGRD